MSALRWINNEVKRLQKLHPHTARKTLQKQAGKSYRAKHGAKHKPPAKKKKGGHSRKKNRRMGNIPFDFVPSINGKHRVGAKLGSVSAGALKSELKKRIKQDIDRAVVRKFHATKKLQKRKLQKSITHKKAELRKLS